MGKAAGREADHSPRNGAEVRGRVEVHPYSPTCLYGVHRNIFTFCV